MSALNRNARVVAFRDAVVGGALNKLGSLLVASHRSLRDDYEVSLAEIDALVDIATNTSGVWGARLTGGGFGGSVVVLADAQLAEGAAEQIVDRYRQAVGLTARVIRTPPEVSVAIV